MNSLFQLFQLFVEQSIQVARSSGFWDLGVEWDLDSFAKILESCVQFRQDV